MVIIDGKKIAEEVLADLKKEISDKNLDLSLGAVLVGDDPEFKKFVELKRKAADKIGVTLTIYQFPDAITTEELNKNMAEISEWSDGVLVELPLPKHIDQQAVLNQISVDKDVDVLSDKAQELFYKNESRINPPAVEALKIVLEKNLIPPKEKKVAVFGQGILIGKPLSHWLEQQGMEVSRIRSTTENPEKLSLEADIIVTGVGKPGLIDGDMVQEGAVVIDFGYGPDSSSDVKSDRRIEDPRFSNSGFAGKENREKKKGKMVGDVDFDSVLPKASLITPVPGGMGPILIAAVLKNLILLHEDRG